MMGYYLPLIWLVVAMGLQCFLCIQIAHLARASNPQRQADTAEAEAIRRWKPKARA